MLGSLMYIHYIALSEIPSQTANAVHVMKMSAAFSSLGHSVTLHAKQGFPIDDIHAFYGTQSTFTLALHKNVRIPKFGTIAYMLATARACRFSKVTPELVYGRDPFSILAAAKLGLPVALELHSLPENTMWKHAIRHLFRSSCMRGIVTITRALRDDIAAMFFLDAESILVAPDAADDPYAGVLPPAPSHPAKPLQIGYVGSLYKGRGVEHILALAERCPDMEFVIVGGSALEIAALRRGFVPNNVRYTGYVPHGQLNCYYKEFDIMLAPYGRSVAVAGNRGDSSRYMSPLKIFEYMSYGKPVIASKLAVLDEILDLKAFCFSPELDDVEQWVACLNTLAHDVSLRASMGARGYSVFLRHFTWQARAATILEWLVQRSSDREDIVGPYI
jgi:glycosyltransferase involved in cell wall biosynthesis